MSNSSYVILQSVKNVVKVVAVTSSVAQPI